MIFRIGGRVLLHDTSGRLLLIHERLEDGGTHWLTPGGGVEAGEDPRDAAAREAVEETGIAVALAGDPVLTTRRYWSHGGTEYDQIDHFWVATVADGTPVRPHALTEVEQQTLLELRWWTLAELRATDEVLLPSDLADVLERVLAAGARG